MGCGLTPLWTQRHAGAGAQAWHIGHDAPPSVPPGSVFLHLAAVLRGGAEDLARNAADTAVVAQAARAAGVRHFFMASTAAVYRPSADDIPETQAPDPANPYGAAKLAAEQAARQHMAGRLTVLRIGNLAGADALLGGAGPVTLDPVPGQPGGPLRSYIGPGRLVQVLDALIGRAVAGQDMPDTLNLAEPGVVAMADLLHAAGRDWQFGAPRSGTVPRVGLDTTRLTALVPIPPATAHSVVADLTTLKGRWP